MHAERKTEFSIFLADRPGELAGVLEAADAARVEVTALCVSHHQTQGQSARGVVRLIGSPAESLRRVCESLIETGKAGPMVESDVLLVGMKDRPGAFRDISAALAKAGVNVQYAYQAPARNGHEAYSIFRVSDVPKAEAAVRDLP
jgi:hypothetical protein